MRVRATRLGVYGVKRMKEGEEFTIQSEKEFSKEWMEKLPEKRRGRAAEPPPEEVETEGEDGEGAEL